MVFQSVTTLPAWIVPQAMTNRHPKRPWLSLICSFLLCRLSGKCFFRTSMRETSAKTVTRARYFSRYPETTVGADCQIADTTQLLLAWAGGDAAALDALAPRIYRELRRPGAVWDMGMLAITAGACAIVAGLWCSGRDNSWLLALHGVALAARSDSSESPCWSEVH